MASITEGNQSYNHIDNMTVYKPQTPVDIVRLYRSPTSDEIVQLYQSSTPKELYRCPVTTPACSYQRPGHRQLFLTQTYSDGGVPKGRSSLNYSLMARYDTRNTNWDTKNSWLNNLCSRPVDEIVNKHRFQQPLRNARHFWSHTALTEGERSILHAFDLNISKGRKDSFRGKYSTLDNISDSAFPVQLGISSLRYPGHTYRMSSGDQDHDKHNLGGPVVTSCTIKEFPARSVRKVTIKPTVHFPRIQGRKKKKKQTSEDVKKSGTEGNEGMPGTDSLTPTTTSEQSVTEPTASNRSRSIISILQVNSARGDTN